MPHGFRCAKETLLRQRQTKPSVPQLRTGMGCGSGGFACQSRDIKTNMENEGSPESMEVVGHSELCNAQKAAENSLTRPDVLSAAG
jgi:hypothetical protein